MSPSKLSSVILLVAIILLAGCDLNLSDTPTPDPSEEQGSFNLEYNNDYNPAETGIPVASDIIIAWDGDIVAEDEGAGNFFHEDDSQPNQISTDPWSRFKIVPNLNPGDWNLSVTVSGLLLTCPSEIKLEPGVLLHVTFQVDEGGVFTGCTSTV